MYHRVRDLEILSLDFSHTIQKNKAAHRRVWSHTGRRGDSRAGSPEPSSSGLLRAPAGRIA